MQITDKITITNENNYELMSRLKNESIDVICIDPPYLYLKNQKLERVFDENKFFSECKRVLTKNGFIIMFGRGTSFYRWNTILDSLGFIFKEEIVWNKSYTTSSMHPISRKHELICIYGFGSSKINDIRVPYEEIKQHDLSKISQDLKIIKSALNNPKELDAIELFLKSGAINFGEDKKRGFNQTIQGVTKEQLRGVKTMQAISNGMKEQSIINIKRDHYGNIHPTQKPVRLIERLLDLVIPLDKEKGDIVVADFFGGSFSTMEAVYNMGMQGISCEIDEEYFDLGKGRILNLSKQQKLF